MKTNKRGNSGSWHINCWPFLNKASKIKNNFLIKICNNRKQVWTDFYEIKKLRPTSNLHRDDDDDDNFDDVKMFFDVVLKLVGTKRDLIQFFKSSNIDRSSAWVIFPMLCKVSLHVSHDFCKFAVWPDLAKFRHFGEVLKVIWQFSTLNLVFGKSLNPIRQILYAFWQIFIRRKWPNITK